MVPTMVRLPGQSRSMVQLLPPPADSNNPLTAVDLARSAEVTRSSPESGHYILFSTLYFSMSLHYMHTIFFMPAVAAVSSSCSTA